MSEAPLDQIVATRFWWVRHAPVPDGGNIYGQNDLPCDCSDGAVFAALAQALPKDAIWATSNLLRAKQTARAILEAGYPDKGVDMLAMPEFAEQHLGDWQGLNRKEFFAARGQSPFALWFAAPETPAPNGESFLDLFARTKTGVEFLERRFRGRDIIIVAHGGVIRAALGLALDLTPEQMLSFSIDNCALTQLALLQSGNERAWRAPFVNRVFSLSPSGLLA